MLQDIKPFELTRDTCLEGATLEDNKCRIPEHAYKWTGEGKGKCPEGYNDTGLTCFRRNQYISSPSRKANCPGGYNNVMRLTYHSWRKWRTIGGREVMTCRDNE